MRSGEWRHLWRIAGQYANYRVFDVASVQELHDTLMQLPLFRYMGYRSQSAVPQSVLDPRRHRARPGTSRRIDLIATITK